MEAKTTPLDWKQFGSLSFSGIEQYLGCAEQFRRVKLGERQPPSIAMIEGSGTHKACQTNNENKKSKGKDLKAQKLVEISMDYVDEELKKPEMKQGVILQPNDKNDISSRAKAWFPEYITKYAPEIVPEWIEQPVKQLVKVDGTEFELHGFIDLVTKKNKRVIDYKTAGQIKSQGEADSSIQLSLNSMFAKTPDVGYLVFVKTKNPYVGYVPSKRTPADHQWALMVAKRVLDSIRKEAFPFAYPDPRNWRCSEKFCGFWDTCRGKYTSMSAQKLEKA